MKEKIISVVFIILVTALLFTNVSDWLLDNYLSSAFTYLSTLFTYPSTLFFGFILVLGTFFTLFLVVFLYAWLIYWAFIEDKNARPYICPADMPILRPIPIPTKNRCFYEKPFVWLMEPRKWRVMEDWCYPLRKDGKTIKLIVPKGFDFDGASIPRLLWFFLNPTGLLLIPGLIHDYAYRYDQMWQLDANGKIIAFPKPPKNGKCYWDNLFYEIGRQVNGFWLLDALAWMGVVFGGGTTWRKHRKKRKAGKNPITKPQTAGRCSSEAEDSCGGDTEAGKEKEEAILSAEPEISPRRK